MRRFLDDEVVTDIIERMLEAYSYVNYEDELEDISLLVARARHCRELLGSTVAATPTVRATCYPRDSRLTARHARGLFSNDFLGMKALAVKTTTTTTRVCRW
jgi:hypothetical protein